MPLAHVQYIAGQENGPRKLGGKGSFRSSALCCAVLWFGVGIIAQRCPAIDIFTSLLSGAAVLISI